MAKKPDILANLSPPQRLAVLKDVCGAVFGAEQGAKAWQRLEPILSCTLRQPGDAPRPSDNYWKGVWRIYEVD